MDLGEFGPQLNLLTELIQENLPHEQVAEVLMDTDDEDEPPGLIHIPDNELQAVPSANAAVAPDLLTAWISSGHVALIGWPQMCQPFSSEQMALISQMEIVHHVNVYPYMCSLNSEV